jgi:Flp pilus assembly protein TadD
MEIAEQLLRRAFREQEAGRLAEAEDCSRAVLALDPAEADAVHLLGVIAHRRGHAERALALMREAVRLRPDVLQFHAQLASALVEAGQLEEAAARFRAVRDLAPKDDRACHSLAAVLVRLGRLDEAEACYRTAARLRPEIPATHNNLCALLKDQGRFAEAEQAVRQALRLNPDYHEARVNLGSVLLCLGRVDEAETVLRAALSQRPDCADTRYNLGVGLLLQGRLAEGFEGFEWRWQRRGFSARTFSEPRWDGSPTGDRVLLLHAEQGLGDTIQFCRYVPAIAQHSRVVLEVPQPLVRLLSRLPLVERVVARGDKLPGFDVQCSLPSLPRVMRTTETTIPAAVPYLTVDPEMAAYWRSKLASLSGLRAGLAWTGNPGLPTDARRSIAPALLRPLAGIPGVDFVSLQVSSATRPPVPLADWTDEFTDLAVTAALISELDLVIAVDTAVVHLAGALRRPTWLLNRFDTCWRWMLGRGDCPWYPSLRQFRQQRLGDWVSVVQQVRLALFESTASR